MIPQRKWISLDSEERMKERIFALLQRIERSFMLSIAVLPVTRSVFGLAIAFANETMITSYNLQKILGEVTIINALLVIMKKRVQESLIIYLLFCSWNGFGNGKRERAVTVLSSVIAFFVMYALINVLLVINGQILADNSIVIMF